MNSQFKTAITYFLQEGRENLRECLRIAFDAAANHSIRKIVIFTAEGQGVKIALDEFCSKPQFSNINLVAVTFPVGKPFTDQDGNPIHVEIAPALRAEFNDRNVAIVKAHLPFDSIAPGTHSRSVLGEDLSLVRSALNIFGGSMSLCVQAVMVACDAGEVTNMEHVIALTSDTAVLVQASPTSNMLRSLAIREILCKPAIYSIGRGEGADQLPLRLSEAPDEIAGPILLQGNSPKTKGPEE
jgi:hypothetical protein